MNDAGAGQREERLKQDHLWGHLTDGWWHDDCRYCLRRRGYGGNGTEALEPVAQPPDRAVEQRVMDMCQDGQHDESNRATIEHRIATYGPREVMGYRCARCYVTIMFTTDEVAALLTQYTAERERIRRAFA